MEYFNTRIQQLYITEGNIVIDESLMKFSGRLKNKQFIVPKRGRFRIKFYKLCESKFWYFYKFKIYIRKDKTLGNDELVLESVAMQLAKALSG